MSVAAAEQPFEVPVDGGLLHGTRWRPATPGEPVLAVHGITANHRCWTQVVAHLATAVIGVDLRGRGRSNALPGPYTLIRQADDLARVLDGLGVDRVVLAGHSMGGFVGVRFAERHPDRITALVLVDGGVPLPPSPPGTTAEDILGPALRRLDRQFPSVAAYFDFWREHPALRETWSPTVEDYLRYDLVAGADGALRPATNAEAVRANLAEQDGSAGYVEALAGLRLPITFLHAERGLLDQPAGLYPPEWLAAWSGRPAGLRIVELPHTNHYTVLFAPGPAATVAGVIADAIAEETS